MTFSEAAGLAVAGNVKKMWLTHYSPSMPDPHEYIGFARRVFAESYVCKDRISETLLFEED